MAYTAAICPPNEEPIKNGLEMPVCVKKSSRKSKRNLVVIFVLCIGGFFLYAYLLMLSEWSPIVLQLSVLMIAGGMLGVVAWIGYVMATTKPSPASITSEG